MSIFDSLFAKHGTERTAQHASASFTPTPGRSLSYDPDLIPRLTQEHHALERLFGDIKQSHVIRDFAALERALHKFHLALNMHLASENTEFYAYLNKSLQNNSAAHGELRNSWEEMQGLGNAILELVQKHNGAEINADTHTAFGLHIERIGTALAKRIRHEEDKLYGLYAPA